MEMLVEFPEEAGGDFERHFLPIRLAPQAQSVHVARGG
jgi:hypothetical protein